MVTLLNNRGFTVTEVLVALTALMLLATVLIPLSTIITNEREVLSQKRHITYQLHDELHNVIHNQKSIETFHKRFRTVEVKFEFTELDSSLVKGCARWENLMNRSEEVCLYGIQN